MSWSWYIYTLLAPPDVVRVDAAYQTAIDAYQAEHDIIDSLAEVGPGGTPPPRPEAVAAYRARVGEQVDAAILARLATCRTTVALDYVTGDPKDSPLQVSALRFLLRRLAPCVFDRGDHSLELGETMLHQLAGAESRGRLGRPPSGPRPVKSVKRRRVGAEELRAARLLAKLSRAGEDPDARLDLTRAVARLSEPARRYLALIVSEGVPIGSRAAASLGLAPDALAHVLEEIEAALREL